MYFGANGWGRLNVNGDRAIGDFEFWGLPFISGGPPQKWFSRGRYQNGVYTRQSGVGF
jgi:hypothetical protein